MLFEKLFKYPPELYRRGVLTFMSRVPGEVWFLVLLLLAAATWLLYRKTSARTTQRSRRALLTLRTASFVMLIFILSVPALRLAQPRESAIFTAVLVDTSRSMSIQDVTGKEQARTRMQAVRELLFGVDESGDQGLLKELSSVSSVLLYRFGSSAERVGSAEELRPTERYTNLFRSLRDVEAQLRSVPLAAVVMITDGCRNTGGRAEDAARLLAARGVPLYTIGVGDPNPPRDYEIMRLHAPRRVRRNSEVELHATIRHTGFDGPFELRVVRGDETFAALEVKPTAGSDLKHVRVAFTPEHVGSATYRLEVPPAKGESVTDNNVREFVIDIEDERLPVLYIEGSPRTEYRFLRRAMFRDPDFRVAGLLRLARDRFYVQGANDDERYLEKGFPTTRERLFAFQAVILGDIEARQFSQTQLALLEEFVRAKGGGLLMLGGVNSFGLGGYARTALEKLLPVQISSADRAYSDDRYNARVTPEGLKHPVMCIVPEEDLNRRYWENMPPLIGITPVRGIKLGAQLLLVREHTDRPVLAVQNYGQGRAAAFTSGGSWYWQVSMPADNEFHEKFWKQLIRWLAVGAREQLSVETDGDVYARHEPVFIRSTVLGTDYRPLNDATVIASVTDPLGNTEWVPMDWILSQEGVYQCRYVPDEEGDYRVGVKVEGADVKPPETGFLVSEPFVELTDAGLKEPLLRTMARLARGRYLRHTETTQLPAEIRKAVRSARYENIRPHEKEIWDLPLLFVLILGTMCTEWFLRRRSGLA